MSITLLPPRGITPTQPFVLKNGTLVKPDLAKAGAITINNEDDIAALIAEGWRLDDASKKAMRFNENLLRKAVSAEARHTGAGAHRTVVGEVDLGDDLGGRVHVEHNAGTNEIIVHGVTADLDDIDSDLVRAFRSASASFDAAQDIEEQATARTTIAALTASILRRHPHIAHAVRQRRFDLRFTAV